MCTGLINRKKDTCDNHWKPFSNNNDGISTLSYFDIETTNVQKNKKNSSGKMFSQKRANIKYGTKGGKKWHSSGLNIENKTPYPNCL